MFFSKMENNLRLSIFRRRFAKSSGLRLVVRGSRRGTARASWQRGQLLRTWTRTGVAEPRRCIVVRAGMLSSPWRSDRGPSPSSAVAAVPPRTWRNTGTPTTSLICPCSANYTCYDVYLLPPSRRRGRSTAPVTTVLQSLLLFYSKDSPFLSPLRHT